MLPLIGAVLFPRQFAALRRSDSSCHSALKLAGHIIALWFSSARFCKPKAQARVPAAS